MPLPTSDFHTTVCLEMRMLRNQQLLQLQHLHQQQHPPSITDSGGITAGFSTINYIEMPIKQTTITSLHHAAAVTSVGDVNNPPSSSTLVNNNVGIGIAATTTTTSITTTTYAPITSSQMFGQMCSGSSNRYQQQPDLASVDSSDTYASCQTHPFFSQGDLTSDIADAAYALDIHDSNNLYINPLGSGSGGGGGGKVKKSASGDTALRTLGADISLDDESEFQTFQTFGISTEPRGSSSTSLNEAPVPKHRKARFQSSKPRTRFEEVKRSQDSLDEAPKRSKRKLFESKSLASATKLINQHLFGHHQSIRSKG